MPSALPFNKQNTHTNLQFAQIFGNSEGRGILGNEGNEPVRGALHIANIHGYVPSPTVTQPQTAIIEDDDPPDGRPPDLDDSAHDAFVATMPQVRLIEATLAAFEAALSASQYTAPSQ